MNPTLVSIGVALFNDEKWVQRTLESILSQQHQNLEILISDDCSSDGTAEICRGYADKDSRVRFIRQKRNIGALANHEFLFNLSSGDYFMWSNGHDFFDSNYIANCLQSLESDPSLVLCCGKTIRLDTDGNQQAHLYTGLDTRNLDTVASFKSVFSTVVQNACLFYGLFRSDILKKSKLHRKTMGGDLIFINEIGLLGDIQQRGDTTFYRQIVRDQTAMKAATEQWVNYIIQPTGFCLEDVAPWLDMAYEYLAMISNSTKTALERDALLTTAIDLLKHHFGGLLQSDIEKIINIDVGAITGHYLRDIYRTEIIRSLNKAKFFYTDLDTLDNLLHKYNDMAGNTKSTTLNAAKALQWADIQNAPTLKLYAGDIPPLSDYNGWVGLSITKNDSHHIQHDITQPFPLHDNTVDSFQAEDVFEHIPYDCLVSVINEIFRILKPGGVFRLSLPDYGCDVLRARSIKEENGNIIFDPGGGGTPEFPGHVWFPRVESVYRLLEKTLFNENGEMDFLHYWNMDGTTYVTRPIDYSKGMVRRTPDHDQRVKNPYRPLSIVVDIVKREPQRMQQPAYYNDSYFNWQKNIGAFGGVANLFKFRDFIKISDTVIDFGCGGGFLLNKIVCLNKVGIEVNPVARQEASKLGICVYAGTEEIADNFADVIISNHALEHVNSPLETLKQLYPKLKTDGLAVFVVPHQDTREEFNPHDVNQHLYTWNQLTLGNLFKTAGFSVQRVEAFQHQWPENYVDIYQKLGEKEFHRLCHENAVKNNNFQIRIVASKKGSP